MLETLVGAGLSGLGSLFSGLGASSAAKSQQKRQEAYDAAARERVLTNTTKYRDNVPRWIIEDADAAGFNPVTWLNGGALGWYGTQLSSLNATYGNATQAVNVPSTMQAVGGAISSFSSAFMQGNQFDRKEALELSSQSLQRDIATMKYGMSGGAIGAAGKGADSMALMGGAGGPIYKAGSAAGVSIGGGVTGATASLSTMLPTFAKGMYSEFINVKPDKDAAPSQIFPGLRPNPAWPAANAVENEYGDVGGSVYGPIKATADIYYNRTGQTGDLTDFFAEGNRRLTTTINEAKALANTWDKSMSGPWASMDNYSWGNAYSRIAPFFSPTPGGSSGPKPIPQW